MTQEEFYTDLEEIKTDKLFLTESLEEIDTEIKNNCWAISIPQGISTDSLNSFLKEVISNRKEQLKNWNPNRTLKFYIWNDFQAGQLRFNFINGAHETLPFRAKVVIVPMDKILESTNQSEIPGPTGEVEVYLEELG